MGKTPANLSSLDRRNFLRQSALAGAGLVGLNVLAACGGDTTSTGPSVVTATVNNLPPSSDPGSLKQFNTTVLAFEKAYPGEKIVGKNDPYDPSTFFAKVAAGQAEDGTESYFTEPPLLIQKHAIADITDMAKKWQYFDSYNPSLISIVTDSSGKVYGLPVTGYTLGILYNRKLFTAAGLDPNKPPTTWDEFRGYAKQLKSSNVAGYAETSTQNQGGWHFTNWMYTAGGDMQSTDGVTSTFNSDKGLSVLQMLKDMRFTDQSMTKEQLFTQNNTIQLLATGKVAMVVMAPDMLTTLKSQYQANLDDFGFGPMPQNGGNAALTGGNVFVFNPKSSHTVLKAAIDYVLYSFFDLPTIERQMQNAASTSQLVGVPNNILFTGELQQKLDALNTKYANVPLQNYTPFTSTHVTLRPEPRNQTQKMYASIDPVMQAILTNQSANPKTLLDQANQQFQQILSQSAS